MAARKSVSNLDLGPLFGGIQIPPTLTPPAINTGVRPVASGAGAEVPSSKRTRALASSVSEVPLSPKADGPPTARSATDSVASPGSNTSGPATLEAEPSSAQLAPEAPTVLSVAGLAALVRGALDHAFSMPAWVEGEVSGAKFAPSGHLYFTLKDEDAEAAIDVVVYRAQLSPKARSFVKDGAKVRLRGKPLFWAPRGRLQFACDRIEPTGQGALLLALEQLKQKLQKEGLFAEERKRLLPEAPRIIGVITSQTGAVIHDIRKVAFRRGGARLLLAPAQVQGHGAADSIRRALAQLLLVDGVDVIIVGRGGGSADDLMCFNDEALVRAIAACPVPVVSAVGHEVDVTLTDFVADRRAATPSQAAEFVVEDRMAQRELLLERQTRLARAMNARIGAMRLSLSRRERALRDPRVVLAGAQQALDERRMRLESAILRRIRGVSDAVAKVATRLAATEPRRVLGRDRARHAKVSQRLHSVMQMQMRALHAKHGLQVASLDALSPLRVLGRGYALVTCKNAEGVSIIVQNASDLRAGEPLRVRVAQGSFDATVTATFDPEEATR